MRSPLSAIAFLVFAPTAALAEAPPPPAAATPAGTPTTLAVGTAGTFKPGILLQGWFTASHTNVTTDSFRVRRAEISARGDILPGSVSYALMVDFAKIQELQDAKLMVEPATVPAGTVTAKQPTGPTTFLQDVFITWNTAFADVSIGQFKIPVSYEGYNSSSRLLFPDRALSSRRFGDQRDIGLRVAKQLDRFGYSAGVWNGSGQNTPDRDKTKDGGLRLELYPVKGLLLAGVVYATLWDWNQPGARERYEGDVRFEKGPLLFQGEYIYGRDVTRSATGPRAFPRSQGFYAAGGFRPRDPLQIAVRFGYLDPNTSAGKDHTVAYEAVVNYYLRGNEARLQLAYGHFQFAQAMKPSEDTVILAAQLSY